MSEEKTLYARLGGYDAIAAVAANLVSRLRSDALLGRFWANRAYGAKHNSSSTFCARLREGRCTTRAGT